MERFLFLFRAEVKEIFAEESISFFLNYTTVTIWEMTNFVAN